MKKLSAWLLACMICTIGYAQNSTRSVAIIPEPVSLKTSEGVFVLPDEIVLDAPSNDQLAQTVKLLTDRITKSTGKKITSGSSKPTISMRLNSNNDATLGNEGYTLSVNQSGIQINANKPAGIYYGTQTLLQLLPKEIESSEKIVNVTWDVPFVQVTDYPRFGWRGMMFDVSRHFFSKEEVYRFIDNMGRYKLNLFHMHLTDDEGWRIEIKSFPKLTSVGAWNVKKEGYFGDMIPPAKEEPRNYGGFYTQDDIRDIVKYAQQRFINILPEIDVPGHSLATIASYPELSCTSGADKYTVRSGEKIMDWSKPGHPALVDNTLCPANEKVYDFLDKVLTEVAQLFPFEYIHMGGDECAKNFWEKSPEVKALMAKQGLKTMEQVQSYFEKRLEKIVESKGKKFMGWDEILEGGLAPSAAVMSWRGMKGGIEAAKMKHDVVMSPTTFMYIDYMQGDPAIESRVYATLRLNKTYEFEPVPEGVDPKYIKGGQANLWTEQVYNTRYAEYMTWPRGMSLAETVWSPKEKKNWENFYNKVGQHLKRFDVAEINYSTAMYEPIVTVKKGAGAESPIVELATEGKDIDIYYSFDNSFPDRFYPKYEKPLSIPVDAVQLKLITYRGKEKVGRYLTIPVEDLKKRMGK
ncbi:MAG TPA: family 20 glycosylhydrolase [Flavitalea sp.]|nr:family 20 glycosylhydrolase [Flavitalea sp.]